MSTEFRTADAAQILTSISHELRNILQSISGCNQLIEESLAHHRLDQVVGYWQIGQQKQETLSQVVEDILFLSENGIPQTAEIKLAEIIRRSIRSVSRHAELSGVTLVCELPKAGLENQCYPDILQRCIQNILELCIRSCPDKANGMVSVSVEHDIACESVSIEIVDNGCNHTADQLQLITSPMAEIDQWDRFLISLAVSRKIALGLDGELRMRNGNSTGKSFVVALNAATGSFFDNAKR